MSSHPPKDYSKSKFANYEEWHTAKKATLKATYQRNKAKYNKTALDKYHKENPDAIFKVPGGKEKTPRRSQPGRPPGGKNPVKTDGTKYGRPAGKPTIKREGVKYGRPPVKRTHGGIIPRQKYTMRDGVKYGRPKGTGNGIKITKVKEEKEEEGGPTNPVGRPRGQKTIKKPNIVYGHPKGQKNKKHVMHKEGVHYGRPKKTHINIDGTTKQKQTDKTNSEGVAQESVEKL